MDTMKLRVQGIKLKPCPFCGSVNVEIVHQTGMAPQIWCHNCGVKMEGGILTILVGKWNRRYKEEEVESG